MRFTGHQTREEWLAVAAGREGRLLLPLVATLEVLSMEIAGVEPLMTSLWRSESEQREIVAAANEARAAAGAAPVGFRRSVHEFWRGADFSVRPYVGSQADEIVRRMNKIFDYGGSRSVALRHTGTADHIHVQAPAAQRWGPTPK